MTARWPQHHLVAALLAGLVAGPLVALLVPVLAAAAWLTQPRRGWATAAVVAVVLGAVAGDLRRDSAWRGALAPLHRGERVAAAEPVEVLEAPTRALDGGWRSAARLRGATVELRTPATPAPPPGMRIGRIVGVDGRLAALSDRAKGPRTRGIALALYAEQVLGARGVRGGWRGAIDRLRERAEGSLDTGDPRRTALLRGMVLGQDDEFDPAQEEAYRRSGLSHIVAASGQNVALLVALVVLVGAAIGVPRRPRIALAILAICAYVPLAGSGPSIRRAGVMGVLTLLALGLGRPADRWWALLLAGVATVVVDPFAPGQLGWQLSFAAVVGLMVLADPIADVVARRGAPRWVGAAAAVPLAAGLSTAPVLAATVGDVSLTSLPANVLVEPVVAPVTWLGMVAGLLGPAGAPLTEGLVGACGPLLGWIEGVARWLAAPGWAVTRPGPVVAAVPAVAVLVGLLVVTRPPAVLRGMDRARRTRVGRAVERRLRLSLRSPGRRVAAAVAAVAVVVAGCVVALRTRGPGRPPAVRAGVVVLDVGQGSATLLRDGDHAVLIDAGPVAGRVVDRVRAAGVDRLDALVLSHAAADHTGGAPAVATALRPRLVLDGTDGVQDGPTRVAAGIVGAAGGRVVASRAGQRLRLGGGGGRGATGVRGAGGEGGAADGAGARDEGGEGRAADGAGKRARADSGDTAERDGSAASTGGAARTGGIDLEVRWPPPRTGPPDPGLDPNERATVVRATVGGLRVLVPSDREGSALRLAAGGPVDLLVMPHHGSADEDVPRLLETLRPTAAIASVGAHNGYGHPAPPTVAAVARAHVPFWRTDRSGSVAVDRGPDGRVRVRPAG